MVITFTEKNGRFYCETQEARAPITLLTMRRVFDHQDLDALEQLGHQIEIKNEQTSN